MAEIISIYRTVKRLSVIEKNCRWLALCDYSLFAEHLKMCGQKIIDIDFWNKLYDNGTVYCGLFVDDKMVARASIEKLTDRFWEVSDVRVVGKYRNRGYAIALCAFAINFVLDNYRTPTIRTEEDNLAMQKVIERLGFTRRQENELFK